MEFKQCNETIAMHLLKLEMVRACVRVLFARSLRGGPGSGREQDWECFDPSSVKHRSAPKEKCPECLSLWGPLGTALQLGTRRSWAPIKPSRDPRGQTQRSPQPKVTSVLTRTQQ